MILSLWAAMENSVVWGPIVKAAGLSQREVLETIVQAFVFL